MQRRREAQDALPHELAAVAAFLSDATDCFDEGDADVHSLTRSQAVETPVAASAASCAWDQQFASAVPRRSKGVPVLSTTAGATPTKTTRPTIDSEAESRLDELQRRARRNAITGRRRDAYRRRLKSERQRLRHQEAELKTELARRMQPTGEEAQERRAVCDAWRAIAVREREGRHAAEDKQRRLQDEVSSRAQLIRDVESLLHKRLREVTEDDRNGKGLEDAGKRRRADVASDTALFEAYLEELDAIYAQTDEVFRTCDTAPTPGTFLTRKPPRKCTGQSEYLENLGVQVIPFEFQRTCSALWEVTHQTYRQVDRRRYDEVPDPENTYAVRFRIVYRLQTGEVVTVLAHFVSRMYIEAGRTVLIWRELWEGEGVFEGMHSDETGWCVLEPLAGVSKVTATEEEALAVDDTAVSDGPATLIRNCVRLVPMHFSDKAVVSTPEESEELTDVLVDSGKEDNMQVTQMMERLQLGDALAAASWTGSEVFKETDSSVTFDRSLVIPDM